MPPTEANSAKTAESLAARAVKSGPVGVESKLSTTTGQLEIYVAIRLGQHLNSVGTARLSTVASGTP
jgi:hypothetical protein